MMTRKLTALEIAMKGKKLQARSATEIRADLDETITWADGPGRDLPVRVKRGRSAATEAPRATRSVTVRFPSLLAEAVEAAADRQGVSLSEFVRGAALVASRPKKAALKRQKGPARRVSAR